MRRTLTVGTLLVFCFLALGWALAQQPEKKAGTVKEDPLDKLLADFAAATAKFEIEKVERLFMPADDTPAGKNRLAHLTEMRKDWNRAKEKGAKEGPSVQFKNTKKIIQTQMFITGPGGPKEGQTSKVEFIVALTDEGWKIVSMEPVRGK